MKVTPFILLGDTQRRSLGEWIQPKIDAWAADWIPFEPSPAVEVLDPAFDLSKLESMVGMEFVDDAQSQSIFFTADALSQDRLIAMLLGAPSQYDSSTYSRVLPTLIREAIADLAGRLMLSKEAGYALANEGSISQFRQIESSESRSDLFQLRIEVDDVLLYLWCPISPFSNHIDSPEPNRLTDEESLVHPREILGRQDVDYEVHLGSCELSLGVISGLQEGDVIKLDKDLQDTLFLAFNQSSVKFRCYLGRQEDHLALRIDSIAEGTGQ